MSIMSICCGSKLPASHPTHQGGVLVKTIISLTFLHTQAEDTGWTINQKNNFDKLKSVYSYQEMFCCFLENCSSFR